MVRGGLYDVIEKIIKKIADAALAAIFPFISFSNL